MTVLVTGATGFVGGAVADRLLAAARPVRVLVRNPETARVQSLRQRGAEIAIGDLTEPATLLPAVTGVEAVFHAAAHLGDAGPAADYQRVNVDGTRSLLAAAAASAVQRFVFVSSPSALMAPDGGDHYDIDESLPYPHTFFNHYCATKAAAEQLVLQHDSTMTCCALRPRAVWGPGDRRGPIAIVLDRLAHRRFPDLDPGHPVLASLCYLDHCVDAAVAALDAPGETVSGRAYFIADTEPVDIWPMLRDIAGRFDLPPPGPHLPLPAVTVAARIAELVWRLPVLAADRTPPVSRYTLALLTRSATYDNTAARRDLGFRPTVTRDEGIARLRSWIDEIGGVDALAVTG
ncbi:NAD-dependent epimerase/dehydratase family protein [Gordonia sp. CPCC 205515]|uniref:NAD-dependent epimerase/dehydratase family protein n=1 Tax=Gordonia sp. CPCC 205515 TaxID=3140791 RepID=UPI003AF3B432